jgi:hypothetical protein
MGGPDKPQVEHDYLNIIDYQTKVRPELQDSPFQIGVKLFMDMSSREIQGEFMCSQPGFKVVKNKEATIYMDSKFAFGVVQIFRKI